MFSCYWLLKRNRRKPTVLAVTRTRKLVSNMLQLQFGFLSWFIKHKLFSEDVVLIKKNCDIHTTVERWYSNQKNLIWCPNGRLVIRLTYISVDRKVLRRQVGEEGAIWEGRQGLGGKPNPGSTCEGNVIKKQERKLLTDEAKY